MIYKVLTLFPEVISPYLESSILGRAQEKGLIQVELCQIRDFAVNTYGKVDDLLYGGGTGMLMMAEPIWQAWCHCRGLDPDNPDLAVSAAKMSELNAAKTSALSADEATALNAAKSPAPGAAKATSLQVGERLKLNRSDTQSGEEVKSLTLFMSPRGLVYDQDLALTFSKYDELIIICGNYEGVDDRIIDKVGALEVSMGDYVLTGGELGALTVIDTVSRLIPGVFTSDEVWQEESHASGLLAEPQYTRPADWRGLQVPKVLLSGHEAKIQRWRYLSALNTTLERRPDMFAKVKLTTEVWKELLEFRSRLAED